MDKMLARLENMEKRYEEINDLLINGSFSDNREYARLSKEQSNLQAPENAYRELAAVMKHIEDDRELLHDPDLR